MGAPADVFPVRRTGYFCRHGFFLAVEAWGISGWLAGCAQGMLVYSP